VVYDGNLYIVEDYSIRPDPVQDAKLEVQVVAYNEERDETVSLKVVKSPRPDDPTEPDWPPAPPELYTVEDPGKEWKVEAEYIEEENGVLLCGEVGKPEPPELSEN
jgi:hypothetical protein